MDIRAEVTHKLPVYTLGAIPDEWAWPGQALEFLINTQALDEHLVAMSIDEESGPQPKGTCVLDKDGKFVFEPDPMDTQPVSIVFSGKAHGKEVTQRCTITPIPVLPAERDRIIAPASLPARDGSLYLTTSVLRNKDDSEDHLVTGMRLVFDKNNDANRLIERYHHDRSKETLPDKPPTRGTIRNLTLVADEIEINGELSLPETNVTLLARRLIFRDQDGSINTSPLPYKNLCAEKAADGAAGRNGGDLTVYVSELDLGNRNILRFNLRGGKGQGAGLGEDGKSGDDNYSILYDADYGGLKYHFDPPAIHFQLSCRIWGTYGIEGDSWPWGSVTWPSNGHHATKPGLPGNASDGGSFTSNQVFTTASSPLLHGQIEQIRLRAKALSQRADRWVTSELYGELKQKKFADMLSRVSLYSLQEISNLIDEVAHGVAAALQTTEREQAAAAKAGLASAQDLLAAAKQTSVDAKNLLVDCLRRKLSDAEAKQSATDLMHMATRMREAIMSSAAKANIYDAGEVATHAGATGDMASDVKGGRAGYPGTCGNWEIRCYADPIGGLHRSWQKCLEQRTTKEGDSFIAQPAQRPSGNDGKLTIRSGPEYRNAWLHPLLLQTVLLYVRDAYLAVPEQIEQLQPMLEDYRKALEARPPLDVLRQIVGPTGGSVDDSAYEQAHAEIATLLHRMASHLDYYGNPSGWTPLFSLPVCLKMYENELDYGLKALLLSRWIGQKAAGAEEIIRLAGESIDSLYAATDRAVDEVKLQQENIKRLNDQSHTLHQEITDLTIRLDHKRSELLEKAEQDARIKSWIDFGVTTISAVAQVIPYGQPVLGTLGSIGKVVANNVINGNDPIQNVGPLTNLLGGLVSSKLDEKAKQIVEDAKGDGKEKPDARAEQAAATADKLTHVGKALGPALNDITSAIQGIAVPYAEVDARLQKLEAECPEFNELVSELRELNLHKLDFAQRLCEAVQTLSTAYAQITNNLLSVNALQQQRRQQAEVLDHQALLYVKTMEQNARATLVKYLYYLAKSGEYALLKPITVNYQLSEITDKILPLLEKDEKTKGIGQLCGDLMVLFKSQMHEIEKTAFEHFEMEYEDDMEIRLSVDQTPHLIDQLNSSGEAVVSLRDLNCVWPGHEQARIADVEIEQLEFDTGSIAMPAGGTIELTFEPRGEGTMRAGNALYVVRHPTSESSAAIGRESQQQWGARYHFGSAELESIKPTSASLALLDYLLHDTPHESLEKIAKPAAWTDVSVRYTRHVQAPDLKAIRFKLKLYSKLASRQYCSLDVRTQHQQAPLMQCSVPDVNGRGHGFGDIYRIYTAGQRLRLSAPVRYGMNTFSHWVVIDNTATMKSRTVNSSALEIEGISNNMLVYCHFTEEQKPTAVQMAPSAALRAMTEELSRELPAKLKKGIGKPATLTRGAEEKLPHEIEAAMKKFVAQRAMATAPAALPRCIFNRPTGVSIGFLPADASYTTLEGSAIHAQQEWIKIDFQGVVGWIGEASGP